MKIGIDIGNSYATIATVNHEGEPVLIKDIEGKKDWEVFTPMRVQIEDQFAYIGQTVNALMVSNYQLNYCSDFFEKIGNTTPVYTDDSKKEWQAAELVALVLRKLKIDAESFSTQLLEEAVVVVPSYFSAEEKLMYKKAFSWSGIPLQFMVEDYRAALAGYGFSKHDTEEKNILIYDFGKTQFHFNIIRCGGGKMELLFSSKKIDVGGAMFDNEVATMIKAQYKKVTGKEFEGSEKEQYYLSKQAELIKARLSSPFLPYINEVCVLDNKPIEIVINRSFFEQTVDKIIQKTIDEIELAFQKITIDPEQLDHLLLIGGSGKIMLVQKKLKAFLGEKENGIICEIPRKIMTRGAAILAYESNKEEMVDLKATTTTEGYVPYAISLMVKDPVTEQSVEQDYFFKTDQLPVNHAAVFSTFFSRQKNIKINVIKNKFLGDLLDTIGIIDIEVPEVDEIVEIEVAANFDKKGELSFSVQEKASGKFLQFSYTKGNIDVSPNKIHITKKQVKVTIGKAKSIKRSGTPLKIKTTKGLSTKKHTIKILTSKSIPIANETKNNNETISSSNKNPYKTPKISPETRVKEMIVNNIS